MGSLIVASELSSIYVVTHCFFGVGHGVFSIDDEAHLTCLKKLQISFVDEGLPGLFSPSTLLLTDQLGH